MERDPELLDFALDALFRYDPLFKWHPPDMARNVIPLDWDDAPEIARDDEAGTVEGDSWFAEALRGQLALEMSLNLSGDGRILYLKDPAHDPRDFWHLLQYKCWKEPLYSRMLENLQNVEPTEPEAAPLPHMIVDGVERELIPGVEFVW